MIATATLRAIARGRLDDARHLLEAGRFDGASYLCGYAVELALKAKICETLNWPGFPKTKQEFQPKQSLRTHSLEVLLSFTGYEQRIKEDFLVEWSAVTQWEPESRYSPLGTVTRTQAELMINSAITLLEVL